MTNYYVNLPVDNSRLTKRLRGLRHDTDAASRSRRLQQMVIDFNRALLLWPVITDANHQIGVSTTGQPIIADDGSLPFSGRTDETGAFFPTVFLSSEVGLANWPDNLVSRIDMIQEFQRSDMMLGGFDFYLADGIVVTVAEYELAMLKLVPTDNTNTTVPEDEPQFSPDAMPVPADDLGRLHVLQQLYDLEIEKQTLQAEARQGAYKHAQSPLLGTLGIIAMLLSLMFALAYQEVWFYVAAGVAGVMAYASFHVSERLLNKRYEKQIASWPYADKLESIETTQTNLGNYNPIMINFLPKYLRSRQAVDMLALYLERGQAQDLPEAIQLYEQN